MAKKILFAASSGGHLEEISRLKDLMNGYESHLLTESNSFQKLDFCENITYMPPVNRRELLFPLKFLYITFLSLRLMHTLKPDFIISLGALATFPVCLLGRIMGKKIIYVESFSRISGPSLTGRLMYRISDLFLVQWEELLVYFPRAQCVGTIF